MKYHHLVSLSAFVVLLAHTSTNATESGTMRCQGGIDSIGDTAGTVVSKCGQPTYATQRERKDVDADAKGSRIKAITTVTVDDWNFNFGPNQFQYRVLLENGAVTGIESLDYGY